MKKNSTGRAPGVIQTSIAIPEKTLKKLGQIAHKETRSRNMQIQLFLEKGIKEWLQEHES